MKRLCINWFRPSSAVASAGGTCGTRVYDHRRVPDHRRGGGYVSDEAGHIYHSGQIGAARRPFGQCSPSPPVRNHTTCLGTIPCRSGNAGVCFACSRLSRRLRVQGQTVWGALQSGADLPPQQLPRDAERITSRRRSFLRPFPPIPAPFVTNLRPCSDPTRAATS